MTGFDWDPGKEAMNIDKHDVSFSTAIRVFNDPKRKIILDFLQGRMPAYLDTGLIFVDVEDVATGHLLAAEKGVAGERYILGSQNMMLKNLLDLAGQLSGRPSPKFKVPYWVAYSTAAACTAWAECTGKPPAVALDAVRMAKELMFYDCNKAKEKLGFRPQTIELALRKAIQFFKG